MAAKKKSAAQVERDRIAKLVRPVKVRVGDVFSQWGSGHWLIVVKACVGPRHTRVTVRDASTGRTSYVQRGRLQGEFMRCGTVAATRAHRKLVAIDARKARKKGGR